VANIKSQKKRILTNAKATSRNRATKSEMRTRLKNATETIGTPENPWQCDLDDFSRADDELESRADHWPAVA